MCLKSLNEVENRDTSDRDAQQKFGKNNMTEMWKNQ